MIDLSVITARVARDRVADQFTSPTATPRNLRRRSPVRAPVVRR